MATLLQHLAGKALGAREAARIRAEHDTWVRTAQLNVPYYTVRPVSELRLDDPTSRNAHNEYLFVKLVNFGSRTGQLLTHGGTGSWTLWYQNGPFTERRQTTWADHHAADRRAEAGEMRRAEAAVTTAVQAEIARLYPASVALIAG